MCPAALRERREYFSSLLGNLCITPISDKFALVTC